MTPWMRVAIDARLVLTDLMEGYVCRIRSYGRCRVLEGESHMLGVIKADYGLTYYNLNCGISR